MARVAVLAGGGAKGAFQAGVLLELHKAGIFFDYVFGVSVGALNGLPVALGKTPELEQSWLTLREKDVYRNVGILDVGLRLMQGKLGLYDNKRTLNLINRYWKADLELNNYWVGFVDLESGEYVCARNPSATEIWASATMPILWDPVGGRYVDGGVRNMTPLGDALDVLTDTENAEIIVILCNPTEGHAATVKSFVDVTKRSLEILMHEVAINDIKTFTTINDLVRQAQLAGITLRKFDGRAYRYVPISIIAPPELSDTIDFSQKAIRRSMEIGRTKGLEFLASRG